MKKNYFFGLFAATMLLTTSCQQENIFTEMWGEKEQTLTLNVALPEMGTATRAYGTGVNAKYLQYAVYSLDAQDNLNKQITLVENVVMSGTNPLGTTISLKIVPGAKYSIVLWADAYGKNGANTPFKVSMSTEANTMVVDASKVKTNDDMTDAFFGSYVITADPNETSGYVITEYGKTDPVGTTLKLKRPFAQLNIAATNGDLKLAQQSDFTITQTSVKIENVQNTLNLRTGQVAKSATGDATTYLMNDIPTDWDKTTWTEHTLLAMNYILMAADKETVKVTFFYSDGTTTKYKEYGNVPLQRNWRTNIYGELFTNPVEITVEIAPNFANGNGEDDDNDPNTADKDEHYSGENGFPTTNP